MASWFVVNMNRNADKCHESQETYLANIFKKPALLLLITTTTKSNNDNDTNGNDDDT